MSCPQEAIPRGWRVWRASVPAPLTQFAIGVRDQIDRYAYGAICATTTYSGATVGAWKSHHQWTYKNGQLVTGICIPGVSLLLQIPQVPGLESVTAPDNLDTPDPNAAVWVANQGTSWPLVAAGAAAATLLIAGFWYALHHQ